MDGNPDDVGRRAQKTQFAPCPWFAAVGSGTKAVTLQLGETKRSVTFEGEPVDVSF